MSAYRRADHFRQDTNSATHAAAYQRAQELGNNGRVFDYRRKIGVAWTGILAPDYTPKELLDAQTLWNTVERIESRKNARLAREMIIALPHQVDLDIHIAMLRAFIGTHLTLRGMIADVAIHKPPVEHGGDARNWHAHVLLTDRPITPTGFAATKDRMWNAKENLLLWRKAWADTHNATMEHLGLPHRIDHRSLEAQRRDALERGDTLAALDLDREPQIHVGKAFHVRHPKRTIYAERRARNDAILTRNKDTAAIRADRMRGQIAKAQNAAHLEGQINAVKRDLWQPEPLSLDELRQRYGRLPALATMMRPDVTDMAATVATTNGWSSDVPPDAPTLFNVLAAWMPTPGHRKPWFTVTARDLAFCFYTLGLITRANLQSSLENAAQAEVQRNPRKARLFPPPPKPTPPAFPTPHADHLARLRSVAQAPENSYLRRLEQLNTFRQRHQARSQRRSRPRELSRARRLAPPVITGLI